MGEEREADTYGDELLDLEEEEEMEEEKASIPRLPSSPKRPRNTKLSEGTETNKIEMLTWDETVEDESLGSTKGTGSQFLSDSRSQFSSDRSGLTLELKKPMDNEKGRTGSQFLSGSGSQFSSDRRSGPMLEPKNLKKLMDNEKRRIGFQFLSDGGSMDNEKRRTGSQFLSDSGSQFSSDRRSGLMLELKKPLDIEKRTQDYILGNWIIAPSRCMFTFRPVRHVGLPLALCSWTTECSNKFFVDFFSGRHDCHQEMITMTEITDLSDKYLAYSNGGWLLFCGPSSTGIGESLFLLKIVTGEYIDLPDIRGSQRSSVYLVSTSSTSPFTSSVEYIVNVTRIQHANRTTIYVTRPDTGSWEVYTITHKRQFNKFNLHGHSMVAAIIFEKKVYVFDHSDRVVVFDLVERRWWSVSGLQSEKSEFHVAESDGKIVKIYSPKDDLNQYRLAKDDLNQYRYSSQEKDGLNQYRFARLEWDDEEYRPSWVEMSESELENKSWFLGGRTSRSWCIKDWHDNGGQAKAAVYQFTWENGSTYAMNIQVHDLKAGTTHSILPFPVSLLYNGWVDLGYSQESRV